MAKLRQSMEMVDLSLPEDDALLAAAGRVALAHAQLELMLRMVVKSLSGLTVREALDATRDHKSWELRKEIKGLVNQKTRSKETRLKVRADLGKCKSLSDRRNELLHNAWGIAEDGSVVANGPTHAWGEAPSAGDLNALAKEITAQVTALNDARLKGFIRDIGAETPSK